MEDKVRKIISRNVQTLLKVHGMTPMDLARKGEVSPSFLGRMLKLETNVSNEKLDIVAKPFGYEGWVLASPFFNPDVLQEQYNSLMSILCDEDLTDEKIKMIVEFAKFQSKT